MKRLTAIILVTIMMFSCLSVMSSAAGDTIATATSISLDKTYSGSITSNSTIDYYKFVLNSSGRINLELSANIQYVLLYIYDSNANSVWSSGLQVWNSTTEIIVLDTNIDLTSGTYYFCVKQESSRTGNYSFKLNYSSSGESFIETQGGNNNKAESADSISLGTRYYGQIAANDIKDFYKFTLSSSAEITLDVSANIQYSCYYIYDSSVKQVWSSGLQVWNSTTELISYNKTISLSKGTYYFCVDQESRRTGNYNFKITTKTSTPPADDIDLSLSKTNIKLNKGETAEVVCSYTGTNSNGVTIAYSRGNKTIVSCEWGGWNNHKNTIYITGLTEGSTTVKIIIKDSKTNEELDYEVINVEVSELTTAPDDNNGGDEGGDGGTGNSSSGTGFFLFDWAVFLFESIIIVFEWIFSLFGLL